MKQLKKMNIEVCLKNGEYTPNCKHIIQDRKKNK